MESGYPSHVQSSNQSYLLTTFQKHTHRTPVNKVILSLRIVFGTSGRLQSGIERLWAIGIRIEILEKIFIELVIAPDVPIRCNDFEHNPGRFL